MLKKFSVSNYRKFNGTLEFDLTAGNYIFNPDCIHQDLVKLALIYGENGTGKSNLGWAIFFCGYKRINHHARLIYVTLLTYGN